MIFKGRKSNKEYTAQDQLDVLKKLVRVIADTKEDIKALNDGITEAKNDYCEEFCPKDEDKKVFNKETKKQIDLEVKALMKEDRTEENALDRLITLKEEARAEREGK
jgi:hypothetical protein